MSEQSSAEFQHAYQLDQNTMAAPAITSCLDEYSASLQADQREEFKQLNLGRQIDRACWDLAQESASKRDSPNLHKAINLRTMHALYTLERYLMTDQPTENWDYWLAVYENPFWQAVDTSLQKFIVKLAHDRYNQHLSPVTIEPVAEDEVNRTVPLGVIADKRISKLMSFGACRKVVNLIYVAEPVN